jgi:hypothetical protein
MKWKSAGAVLVPFFVGCGISERFVGVDPSDSAEGGSSGESVNHAGAPAPAGAFSNDAALALRAWRERLAAATCARQLACWAFWSSEDDCLQSANTYPDYARFFGGVDEDSAIASTHTLAGGAVLDGCIAAVTGSPCDDSRTPYAACLDVLVQKDARERGEPCAEYSPYLEATRCGVGLVCAGTYPCLTCEPLPRAGITGEACSASQDCAPGLACVRGACREYASLPGQGESCAEAGTCRGALHCSLYSKRCVRPGAENDACDRTEADTCLRDLTCSADVAAGDARCHAFAPRGSPCPRSLGAAAASCDDDSWCVFETSDAPSGTCGIAPLSAGPCALFSQDSSYFCPAGTYADTSPADATTLPSACDCKPQRELGVPCDADVQCLQGFCDGADPSDHRCVPLLADGAACSPATSTHCAASAGCNATGTCGRACK